MNFSQAGGRLVKPCSLIKSLITLVIRSIWVKSASYFSYSKHTFLRLANKCFLLWVLVSLSMARLMMFLTCPRSIRYCLPSYSDDTLAKMLDTKSKVVFVLKYWNIPIRFSRMDPFVFPSPRKCTLPSSSKVKLVRNMNAH